MTSYRRPRKQRWNVAEAKAKLSQLVESAARGDEIILTVRGTPRARLVPYGDPDRLALRVPGKGRGRFRIGPDFNDPLPPEVLASFLDSEPA